MPNTQNAYLPDQGDLQVTISAADVLAIAAFTTAEDVDIRGALRKLEETQPLTRQYSEVYVAATSDPIKTTSRKNSATVWNLMLVDDYSKGDAGEWGTDLLSAVEIFQEFFDAGITISTIKLTPAGTTGGMIETTLSEVDIQSITHPPIDADSTTPQEVTIVLVVESYTKAVHA